MTFNPGDIVTIRVDEQGNTIQELLATKSGSNVTFNNPVNFEAGLTSSGAELNQDFLPISGGSLTGPLILTSGLPTNDNEATSVAYVSSEILTTSGILQAEIGTKSSISYVNTQDSSAVTSGISFTTSVSGVLQSDISSRALKTYVDSQDLAAVTSGNNSLIGASGVLQTAINLKAATTYVDSQDAAAVTSGNTALNTASGTLQTAINLKAATTYVDSQDAAAVTSGSVALTAASGVLNSRITSVSGNLQTDINTRALTSYVNTQDAAAVTSGSVALTTASGVLQTNINTKVAISGGTLTGMLTLFANPTVSGHAANKFYVDQQDAAISGALQTSINAKVDSVYNILSATADITTTSTTYVVMGSFTTTPASGTYLVGFNSSGRNSNGAASNSVAVFNNGTLVADSERLFAANSDLSINTSTVTSVNGSQAIDIRFKVSAGTMTVHARNFIISKL